MLCIKALLEIKGDVSLDLRSQHVKPQLHTNIYSQTFVALAEPLTIRAIYLAKCLNYLAVSNFQVLL
ncbi:hypothetical protein N836_10295 [Leptolyngbya sp. Heron Island J]|nr:hypothetical protein N836_10295 [Leptolyngbya sp. Heron Island J]